MEHLHRNKIIELEKEVADKIAAGEVVDRPLSIVKELVENSIDAGSTSIIVEIKSGGKTYIRVTDNGFGIVKEDVELAFKRHATSKIHQAKDLDSITSLGFRGEALASIAAVSRTELITKTKDDSSGIKVRVEGGAIVEKTPIGCPDGTTIIVEDLFYNTPARLKFMKADSTESTLIIDFISKMALAYPFIRIRLINNGNILFSTPGKGDIYSNILTIHSKEMGEQLIHFKAEGDGLTLEAYISNPGYTKSNRKNQIFFVNGRNISSKLLEKAVREAYREKVFEGRYPIVFIFLQVPPDKLDVNIHPHKKEVRFEDENKVQDFIVSAISKHLNTLDGIIEINQDKLFKNEKPIENPSKEEQVDIKHILSTMRSEESGFQAQEKDDTKGSIALPYLRQGKVLINENRNSYESNSSESKIENPPVEPEPTNNSTQDIDLIFESLTIMGSVFGTYIIAQDGDFLYMLDQHAAHERILYEKLLEQYQKEDKMQQPILTPFIFHVPYAVTNEESNWLAFLHKLGYDVEPFGVNAYIVKAIPFFMELKEARDFIDYLVDNIDEVEINNQTRLEKIISKACQEAIKANDILDMKEMDTLIRDLRQTKNPTSCPHGRPTLIKLSKNELDKMFKRV
ncbi:MAG: DNA mismatch repair endonuclease MutL [Anaerovoracaceae bacterium]|jgi:DNA mismatch repair protein MutL